MRNFQLLILVRNRFAGAPYRLKLMFLDLINFTDPKDIAYIFRHSSELTNGPYRMLVSSTFGVPEYFQNFFAADNSGLAKTPHPNSNIKPEDRINYLMYKFIVQFMTGENLKLLAERFTDNLANCLQATSSTEKNDNSGDLYKFVRDNVFRSSVEALFGNHIFEINPDFCDNSRAFEAGVPDLAKGLPRFVY